MTATATATVTDAEIARALDEALRVARTKTRGRGWEVEDKAQSAAADAVVWCAQRFDPERGESFGAFAGATVSRFISRALQRHVRDTRSRPAIRSLPHGGEDEADPALLSLAARPDHGDGPSLELQDLPPELCEVVHLYYAGYDLREVAEMMGRGKEWVRLALRRAAELLADPQMRHRPTRAGQRLVGN